MDAQQFVAEFGHIANAPGGVARLREMVLHFAISGQLTERCVDDIPAEALIEENRNRQKLLVNQGALKRQPEPKPVANGDRPWELPNGWMWTRLGSVTNYGDAPKVEFGEVKEDTWVLELEDIEKESSRLLAIITARERKFKSTKNGFPAGAILYGKLRPYLDKVLISDAPGVCTTEINPISFFHNIDARYLRWYLKSRYFIAYADGSTYGMNLPRLGTDSAREALFSFPPKTEQTRIVAKVDELMALCDKLEAQQQERESRKTVLAQALFARFAEDPTQDNLHSLFQSSRVITPADLRKAILTLAVQGKLIPFGISTSCTVGDHVEFLNGYAFKSEWFKSSGIRLCRNVNVGHGELNWKESVYIDNVNEKDFSRFALNEGDIVLSLDRPIISTGLKLARIKSIDLPCLLLQRVAKPVRKDDKIELSYFFLWMNSPDFINSINPSRSNGVPHISTREVQRLPLTLPSPEIQQHIVAKVDQLMALVDKLEIQIAIANTAARALLAVTIDELTGTNEQSPQVNSMNNTDLSKERRPSPEPLKLSIKKFVLHRFAMKSDYRSLGAFDCTFHSEPAGTNEASPICLVGLNGSGKSNLIEAIAEVFCFLELINLPWKPLVSKTSRYRANRHQFELEYTVEDSNEKRHILIRKTRKSGADFYIVKPTGAEEPVEPGVPQLQLLPRRVIGYSSGLNETVSHPFLRTKTLYSQEVRDAAPAEGSVTIDGESVFDTRTLYLDYESNAAIIISNYIFRSKDDLADLEKFTRVGGVSSFGLRLNRKRARKSGPNSIVRMTGELRSYLQSFARIAGISFDDKQAEYALDYRLTTETISAFRSEFGNAETLFMAMHKWSLLNALILSDEQRNVYLSSDITSGALERPPSVPPSDRVFNIVNLKLMLSQPAIEIDYSGLSDGEHQFMQIFGTALLFNDPGSLFLFDEPESHFNPEWRTKFNQIINHLPNASSQEYIISTHSPYLVSGSRKNNVFKFTRNGAEIQFSAVDFETYGASFDALLKKLFLIDSLIDESARDDLQGIIQRGDDAEMNAAVQDFAESKEKRRLYEALIRKETVE